MNATLASSLLVLLGFLLSMAFEYIPQVHNWYNRQPDSMQRFVMLIAIVITAGLVLGANCANITLGKLVPLVPCTQNGIEDLVATVVYILIGNTTAFVALPKIPTP